MLRFYLNSGDCGGGSVEASFDCSDVGAWVYETTISCFKYDINCFCQFPLSAFLRLLFFNSKDELLAPKLTGKKIIWYVTPHKDKWKDMYLM